MGNLPRLKKPETPKAGALPEKPAHFFPDERYSIPYEDLHACVRAEIDKLSGMRWVRRGQAAAGGGTIGIGIPLITSINIPPLTMTLLLTGAAAGYAIGSEPVARQTRLVGEAVKKYGLIAPEKRENYAWLPQVEKLRKTHPFIYVDRWKKAVLVPDGKLERLAQKTRLVRTRTVY